MVGFALTSEGDEGLGAMEDFFASPRKVAEDIPRVDTLVPDKGLLILQVAVEALVSVGPPPVVVVRIVTCPSEMAVVCSRPIPRGAVSLFFPTNPRGLVDLLLSTLLGAVRVFSSIILLGEVKMFVSMSFIREVGVLLIIPLRVVGVVSSTNLLEGLVSNILVVVIVSLSFTVVLGAIPWLSVIVMSVDGA